MSEKLERLYLERRILKLEQRNELLIDLPQYGDPDEFEVKYHVMLNKHIKEFEDIENRISQEIERKNNISEGSGEYRG